MGTITFTTVVFLHSYQHDVSILFWTSSVTLFQFVGHVLVFPRLKVVTS